MKLVALILIAVLVMGCSRTIDATPVKEPQRVDCDLIFPGPSSS
jgi:hypothetical protein